MASGYTTSDNKDLDERYLGINAKAASAVVADSANSAPVQWSKFPAFVIGSGKISVNESFMNITSKTYTYTFQTGGRIDSGTVQIPGVSNAVYTNKYTIYFNNKQVDSKSITGSSGATGTISSGFSGSVQKGDVLKVVATISKSSSVVGLKVNFSYYTD